MSYKPGDRVIINYYTDDTEGEIWKGEATVERVNPSGTVSVRPDSYPVFLGAFLTTQLEPVYHDEPTA